MRTRARDGVYAIKNVVARGRLANRINVPPLSTVRMRGACGKRRMALNSLMSEMP